MDDGSYAAISWAYERIFPAREPQLRFFRQLFRDRRVRAVLDLACGTGEYALAFARWGLEVVGVDLEESMIRRARERARELDLAVDFRLGDMREPPAGPFDAVICIGNSLPHLLRAGDLRRALRGMARALEGHGILVIQTVNYDRVLRDRVTSLPTITAEEGRLEFRRRYEYLPDSNILFKTELRVQDATGWRSFPGETLLRPLLKGELERELRGAGFKDIQFFGGFDRSPFGEDSPAMVAVASLGS